MVAEENVITQNNGREFSIFGWVSLRKTNPKIHPLFKLGFQPNYNESSEFFPDQLKNFFSLSYDN